jgi:hypothetical protein
MIGVVAGGLWRFGHILALFGLAVPFGVERRGDNGVNALLTKNRPEAVEIRRIVRSVKGRTAAIEATKSRLPALSGVDRLLRENLRGRYKRPDRGTAFAGVFVA